MGTDKWSIVGFGDYQGSVPTIDQRRARQFRNTAIIHIDKKEGLKSKDVKVAMRTQSPDDIPVIGALKHYPNVYVNSGHGERNVALSIASAKLLT